MSSLTSSTFCIQNVADHKATCHLFRNSYVNAPIRDVQTPFLRSGSKRKTFIPGIYWVHIQWSVVVTDEKWLVIAIFFFPIFPIRERERVNIFIVYIRNKAFAKSVNVVFDSYSRICLLSFGVSENFWCVGVVSSISGSTRLYCVSEEAALKQQRTSQQVWLQTFLPRAREYLSLYCPLVEQCKNNGQLGDYWSSASAWSHLLFTDTG